MKIYSTVLIITAILLISLFSELEAKKVKGEKIKAEKIKEKVAHKHVKPQPDHPKVKHSETTTSTPKVQKIVKTVKHTEKPAAADHTHEKVEVIEEVVIEKKPFKPRPPKTLSEYDQCKLECKKKRDQLSAQEYVDHLTEELKLAKEYLATQEKEAAAAVEADHGKEGGAHATHKGLADTETHEDTADGEDHLEQTPVVEKPIIEVTLHHQTAKDEV